MRGYLQDISVNQHLGTLQEQQVGGAGVVLAGVPVFSGAIPQQEGGGFWSSVWSGIKSIGKAILPTLVRTGADFLDDVQQPGVNVKKAGVRRLGEASSDLLSMASEAVRRRTQGGQGRKRRRTISTSKKSCPKKRRRRTVKKYKTGKITRKRSVKKGKQKKKKRTRKTTTTKRRKGSGGGGRRKVNFINF